MIRESVHLLRFSVACLLLGVSAALQLRWIEVLNIHPVVFMLMAIFLCPAARISSGGNSVSIWIGLGFALVFNLLEQWWLGKTGQPFVHSLFFVVPMYAWILCAMLLSAARTIRILPVFQLTNEVGEHSRCDGAP